MKKRKIKFEWHSLRFKDVVFCTYKQTHIRKILLSISLRFFDYKGHHSSKCERRKNDNTILLPFLRFFLSSERKINHESEM